MKEDKFRPIVLTEKQEAWLIKHFKHTKNEEIAKKLNISLRSVVRLARRRGLEKSRPFMKKIQKEAAEKANISNRVNGTYPPKGYCILNREKSYFKKGEKPIDRLGEKKEEERIAKSAASRRETYRLEKGRALFGLPLQTKMKVVRHPRQQVLLRYRLKKLGYIIERGGRVAYYDDNTKRHMELEQKPRTGFIFKQVGS